MPNLDQFLVEELEESEEAEKEGTDEFLGLEEACRQFVRQLELNDLINVKCSRDVLYELLSRGEELRGNYGKSLVKTLHEMLKGSLNDKP